MADALEFLALCTAVRKNSAQYEQLGPLLTLPIKHIGPDGPEIVVLRANTPGSLSIPALPKSAAVHVQGVSCTSCCTASPPLRAPSGRLGAAWPLRCSTAASASLQLPPGHLRYLLVSHCQAGGVHDHAVVKVTLGTDLGIFALHLSGISSILGWIL